MATRTVAVFLLVLVLLGSLKRTDAASTAPSMRIHIRVTGAYRYSGTFTHAEGMPQVNGCSVVGGTQDNTYNLDYNGLEVIALFKGKVKRDSLALVAHGYVRGTRYASTAQSVISLVVIIHKHAYLNEAGGQNTVQVRVAKNGLSGTITASRLAPYEGSLRNRVNLEASWTCSRLK